MKHGTTRYYPTLLLCLFLGFLGIHRFYNGRVLSGIIQLCTCGGLGWWWLADFVLILLGKFKGQDGNPITCRHRATSPAQTSPVMYNMLGTDQKDYGPVTLDQMRQWIAEGRANAQTHMRPAGSSDWRPLNTIPELAALLPPPVPRETPPPVPAPNLEFKMNFSDTLKDVFGLYTPPQHQKQAVDQHWDYLNHEAQWTYMSESEKEAWRHAHRRAADKQYKAFTQYPVYSTSGIEAASKIQPEAISISYRTKLKAYAAKLKDDEEKRRQQAAAAAVPPPPPKPTNEMIVAEVTRKYGPSGPEETLFAFYNKFKDPIVDASDMSFETFLKLYRPGKEPPPGQPAKVTMLRCPTCNKPTRFPVTLDLEYERRRGGRQFIQVPLTVEEVLTSKFISGEAICVRCHETVDSCEIGTCATNAFVKYYVDRLPDDW